VASNQEDSSPIVGRESQAEDGTIAQTNKPTKPAKRVLDAPKLKPPERFLAISSPDYRSWNADARVPHL